MASKRSAQDLKRLQETFRKDVKAAAAANPATFDQLRRLMLCSVDRNMLALAGASDMTQVMRLQGRVMALNELEEMIFGDRASE